MTTTATKADPVTTVKAFFDAYRRHDTLAMVDLCSDNAGFSYVAVRDLDQTAGDKG